jgi:hypothetical protein
MIRKYWLVVIFGAGIAFGLWLGHPPDAGQEPERVVVSESPMMPPAPPAPPARPIDAPPIHSAAPAAEPAQGGRTPPASISLIMENAEAEHWDYGDYNGYSLPVDAGPNFGAQIAESIRTGRNDSLALEHLQLEREVRDDSWSYPLEAELQDMLAADPVLGKFKVEHLECRATLCELRVSGKDRLQQSSAVNQWLRDMGQLRWPGGLTVGTAVFSGTEGGSEGMLMLRKPPAKG